MVKSFTLGALLFAVASTTAVPAQTRPDIQLAYKAALTELARVRVEWQLCNDYLPSSLRDLTEMTLDTGERFKIMTRQEAIDFVNDAQGFRRVEVNRQCGPSRVGGDPLKGALDELHRLLGVTN